MKRFILIPVFACIFCLSIFGCSDNKGFIPYLERPANIDEITINEGHVFTIVKEPQPINKDFESICVAVVERQPNNLRFMPMVIPCRDIPIGTKVKLVTIHKWFSETGTVSRFSLIK